MEINEFYEKVEETLLSEYEKSSLVEHAGDRGENREDILRAFLAEHLPQRFGVTKGEVVSRDGSHSHAADLIIYDALNCPLLYSGKTCVVPVEGVYGIIEVKSKLSKAEFVDAMAKIEKFKMLAPRNFTVVQGLENRRTYFKPSRPFGIILAYKLSNNSLDSLLNNWEQENERIQAVNLFTNLVVVLSKGLLHFENANLSWGRKTPLLDTDEYVNLILERITHDREPLEESVQLDEIVIRLVKEELGNRTFGRFFVYLLLMLTQMRLALPDIGYLFFDSPIPRSIPKV